MVVLTLSAMAESVSQAPRRRRFRASTSPSRRGKSFAQGYQILGPCPCDKSFFRYCKSATANSKTSSTIYVGAPIGTAQALAMLQCIRKPNFPEGLRPRPGGRIGGHSGSQGGEPARKESADRYSANVLPVIQEIQRSGIKSLRGIARALAARGIPTARGGAWTPVQVSAILQRAS
jgi:Recombinase